MPIPVGYVGGWGAGLRVLDVPNRVVNATLATSQFAFQMVIAANTDATYLIDTTRVSKFDRSTNTITAQIAVPGAHLLVAGAVSPDGRWVYAVDRNGTKVFVVDTVAPNPVTSITVGGGLISAMLNADGSRLYVGSEWTNAIYVIDTATNTPTGDSPLVTTGANSEDLTLSPDGSKMLVSNTGAGVVSVIDTATNQVNVGAITGATQVYATVYSPDGSWIYAIGYDGTVRKYSAANYALDSSLAIGNLASGGAISPDGSTLFVTRFIGAGEVVPIDLTTSSPGVLGTAGTPITGFAYPRDIILADAVVPGAPTIGVVTTGDSQATVNFTAPTFNGGTAISSYQVVDAGHGVNFSCPGTTSPCVVTGLTNGTTYDLTIVATNAVGDSAASQSAVATPGSVPAAPTIGTATAGLGQASITFTANGNGGTAITGYTATDSVHGSFPCAGTSSPCVVTGLSNGATYTFTLYATNAVGDSTESAAANAVVPQGVPAAPAITSATRGNGQVTLMFTDGAENGSAITGHTATWSGGTQSCPASSPCVVTGLANGTPYTFTLHATNGVGDSPESAASSSATPATVPGAPGISSAVPGNGQVTVNFTGPAGNGGLSVTGYRVVDAGHSVNFSCPGPTSPCVVTGLSNGTEYALTLVATNAVGDSAASSAVSVTPATVPDAPAIADLRVRGAAAVVTFGAPVGTGGAAIVGYEYRTGNGAWHSLPTTGSGPYTGTITGLTPGASYTITLRAVNNAGGGPASAGATVLIPAVPGAPGGVSATAGAGRATVAFTAPGSDGGSAITTYTATARPGRATATCTASPCTVTGLDNGTSYTFTVRAANAIGDSAESVASAPVTPVSVPGAPTRLIGQPTATTIAVIFAEPDPGGLPITGHDVSSDGGATWQPLVAETLTGLTPGTTYELTVRAVNAAGAGPAAEPVSVTTRPAAVPAPTATAGVASATVSWSRASSRTVTGYVVYARPGPATCTTTSIGATSCVIGGTAGVGYTYTVVALGPGGDSEPSDASNLVTPSAPPVPSGPPTDAAPTLTTPNGQPAELVPSQKVTLLGTGFAAHSTARIVLYSDPVVLGTAVANNLGNLTKGITLPAGLTPGVHVLVVTGVDPDGETHQIRMTFTVKAPDRPGDLPTTGPDVTPLFVFGLGLVAAGLLLASRRRA